MQIKSGSSTIIALDPDAKNRTYYPPQLTVLEFLDSMQEPIRFRHEGKSVYSCEIRTWNSKRTSRLTSLNTQSFRQQEIRWKIIASCSRNIENCISPHFSRNLVLTPPTSPNPPAPLSRCLLPPRRSGRVMAMGEPHSRAARNPSHGLSEAQGIGVPQCEQHATDEDDSDFRGLRGIRVCADQQRSDHETGSSSPAPPRTP